MARISGIELPNNKKVYIGLTYLYGVGPTNVHTIITQSNIDGEKRMKELTDDEVSRIMKVLEGYTVEGDLRRQVQSNIQLLRDIGAYRGTRHAKALPARGQRTRSNGRTKRGKRVTIGAMKKEVLAKMQAGAKK